MRHSNFSFDISKAHPISVLTSDSELGAGTRGASLGPQALLFACAERGVPIHDYPINRYHAPPMSGAQIAFPSIHFMTEYVDRCVSLCERHRNALRVSERTLIISGDHSTAAGFVAGLRDAYPDDRVGLIWIDAHGDIHTPFTTPSGNIHGMPVAALLGIDNLAMAQNVPSPDELTAWNRLKTLGREGITPKLYPHDVFFIDSRDLEAPEWCLIEQRGIECITAAERAQVGIKGVIERVGDWAEGFDHIYVSFDVDALDAPLVRGTGCPVPGGLSLEEAQSLLQALCGLENLRTLEICEINPLLDDENQVARSIAELLWNMWEALVRPSELEQLSMSDTTSDVPRVEHR
ncbi:MAG: arginase [Myxococcota bacterium]|nr:arginase [Myxococcota bacterium]